MPPTSVRPPILWDRATGPHHNAIVWQCRRTAELVDRLRADGLEEHIRAATGLVPDAYFSATRFSGVDHGLQGALCFARRGPGRLWKLLAGPSTPPTSPTPPAPCSLVHPLDWDDTLLSALEIPRATPPQVRPSSEVYGYTDNRACASPSPAWPATSRPPCSARAASPPATPRTPTAPAASADEGTGDKPCASRNGLLTTVAVGLDGGVQYALEGSVFVGGAVIQWLRDELRFFPESRDAEYYAQKVPDNGGVYLVPAFTGLGLPHGHAGGPHPGHPGGGTSPGSRSPTRVAHLVLRHGRRQARPAIGQLKADGGASRDAFLMQFQADILDREVRRPAIRETTALGAAYLAGWPRGCGGVM